MICRLCLTYVNLNLESRIQLFDPDGIENEAQLIKMIAKYLHLQITKEDDISTIICAECSNQLKTFHRYCEYVEQQQNVLSNKFLMVESVNHSNHERRVHSEVLEPMEFQLKCEPDDYAIGDDFGDRVEDIENHIDKSSSTLPHSHSSKFESRLSSTDAVNQIQTANRNNTTASVTKDHINSNTNENYCINCHTLKDLILQQFENTANSFNELNAQNQVIMEALATQKALSEKILCQESNNESIRTVFPLDSTAAISKLNEAIDGDNLETYITTMKSLLKGKLSKTITQIFSTGLIIEINLDGTHGKKRLKDFQNFYDALMDALRSLVDSPEKDLRKAIQVVKKRYFHNRCVNNKK